MIIRTTSAAITEKLPQLNIVGLEAGFGANLAIPLQLTYSEGEEPSSLRVRILRSFENYDEIDDGQEIRLYDDKTQRLLFRGFVLTKEPNFSPNEDCYDVTALDVRWWMNRKAVYWHPEKVSPKAAIEIIWDGARDASGSVVIEEKIGSSEVIRGTGFSLLPSRLREYPFYGDPAGNAVIGIIHNEGNLVVGVEHGRDRDVMYVVERSAGPAKSITAGISSGAGGHMKVMEITGTKSSAGVINRIVGMGDHAMMELTTEDSFDGGGAIEFQKAWDTDLEATVLADPANVFRYSRYNMVGRLWKLNLSNTGGVAAENIITALVQKPYKSTETDAYHSVPSPFKFQLWIKETDRESAGGVEDPAWEPSDTNFRVLRDPQPAPNSTTAGSERTTMPSTTAERTTDKAGDVYVLFDAPMLYASKRYSQMGNTAYTDTLTYDKFLDIRLTFTVRRTAKGDNNTNRWGRIWRDTGKIGSFPLEVERYYIDETFKYMKRNSQRPLYDSDGDYDRTASQSLVVSTVRDDRAYLMDHIKKLVARSSEPVSAFQVRLSGLDFDWKVGDVLSAVNNASGMHGLNWTVIRVVYDLIGGYTTLITDDERPFLRT